VSERPAVLAARLDGLASALVRAGAPADAAARLLELASVATMTAVALEHAVASVPAAAAEPVVEPRAAERRAA
jgi:hypothetical protein